MRGALAMAGLNVLNNLADAGGPSDVGPAIGASEGSESEMVGRCSTVGGTPRRKRRPDEALAADAWYIHGRSYECGIVERCNIRPTRIDEKATPPRTRETALAEAAYCTSERREGRRACSCRLCP